MHLGLPPAFGVAIGLAVFTFSSPLSASDAPAGLKWSTSVSLDETFDSNVYLQSTTPLANRSSWVTSTGATFELGTQPGGERAANVLYAPTWTVFHSAHGEDFIAHRFSGSAKIPVSEMMVSAQASVLAIDGSDENIVWTGLGGPPAVGGPSVRDRRDQVVYRASLKSEWKAGTLLLRPVATLYRADFQTAHRTTAGYQNCVDRGDYAAGADVLVQSADRIRMGLGLRYGGQSQKRLLEYPEEYDNRYARILAVVEGPLWRWCSVSLSAGPEFRRYGEHVHAAFGDRSRTNPFIDATATLTPAKGDTIVFSVRQYQQMSSSGRGTYDDRAFDLNWRHTLSKRASCSVALRAYNTAFLRPAIRDDWVYTGRIQGSLVLTESWTLDGSLHLERGASDIPNMPGREYRRHAVSLGLRARL